MKERGTSFTQREHAVLNGYILKFNKKATGPDAKMGEGKGNIEYDTTGNATVEGALYTIIKEGLERLDRCEGYPTHYDRKEMVVYADNGTKVNAWVYIAQPNMIGQGLKPTKEYLSHYLKAKDLLSPTYFDFLHKTETLDC